MAKVFITLKIMPESPDVDLEKVQAESVEKIKEFGGDFKSAEVEPIAFGLKAVKPTFVMDESLGGTDSLEESITALEGVNSVEVISCSRALG